MRGLVVHGCQRAACRSKVGFPKVGQEDEAGSLKLLPFSELRGAGRQCLGAEPGATIVR